MKSQINAHGCQLKEMAPVSMLRMVPIGTLLLGAGIDARPSQRKMGMVPWVCGDGDGPMGLRR